MRYSKIALNEPPVVTINEDGVGHGLERRGQRARCGKLVPALREATLKRGHGTLREHTPRAARRGVLAPIRCGRLLAAHVR